mmetsp:Transcript_123901/g.174762  ORF Transcript_123901/g.174762 Transcript_123901/m.174762 type:complete len:235 (+) Transcript_123901:222-926(+)
MMTGAGTATGVKAKVCPGETPGGTVTLWMPVGVCTCSVAPALTPAGTVTVMLCTGAMPAMPATPEAEEMQMTRMVRACLGLHGPVHIVRYSAVKAPCDVVLNSSHAILIAWSWAWFKLQIRTRPPKTMPTAKKTKPTEMKLVTPNFVSVPALARLRMALTNGNKAKTRPRKGNLSSQYLAHVSLTLSAKPFQALSGMAASIGGLVDSLKAGLPCMHSCGSCKVISAPPGGQVML